MSSRLGSALAHAFGERYDSPVPIWLFAIGGALVVLLSFVLVARREVIPPQEHEATDSIRLPRGRWTAAISVLVLTGLIVVGVLGTQEVSENLLPTIFWVYLWVVLPLTVGVVGDFTRSLNPFIAIARAAGRDRVRRLVLGSAAPLPWPRRLGYWPAVAAFFVVVVGELIVNAQATLPRVIAVALVAYAMACAVGGLVFGPGTFVGRGEMFAVVLATWGRLGYLRFGSPGRRGFAGGLGQPFEASTSRVVLVLSLLVAVTFDGLLSTPQWQHVAGSLPGAPTVASVFALLTLTVFMVSGFGLFASATALAGRHPGSRVAALAGLLPSLLPIAFGYQLAHYLQYIAINGQMLLPLLGDPMGRGWSLLPYPFTEDYTVNTTVMPISVLWYVQIVVIVAAHVVAVVLAHGHLTIRSPAPALARRAEWPWLVAMVGYTMISLWLLAQPLVERAHDAAS